MRKGKQIPCTIINPPTTLEEKKKLDGLFTDAIADIIINHINELPVGMRKKAYEDVLNTL